MRKTSVYLDEGLKDDLAALADRWGRSEAELIRLAIDRLVRSAESDTAPGAPPAVAPGPRLVGVGVGPSDPSLVTHRAAEVLRAADRIVAATTSPDAIGRAEAVVRAVAPDRGVDRLVISIGSDDEDRRASIRLAAESLVDHLDRGELVAFAVLGDPHLWSVFPQIATVVSEHRPNVAIETVPGILSFQELAARTGTEVAAGSEELALMTLGSDLSRLESLLESPDRSVVIYKGGRVLPEVVAVLERLGRVDGAVVGEMLGLPGGRSGPIAAVADRPASYLATVIVPPLRDGGG